MSCFVEPQLRTKASKNMSLAEPTQAELDAAAAETMYGTVTDVDLPPESEPTLETPTPEPQDGTEGEPGTEPQESDTEAIERQAKEKLARRIGWKSKEEFGDRVPDDWCDAEEYVVNTQEITRRQAANHRELSEKLTRTTEDLKALREADQRREEQLRQREIADLNDELREATEEADFERVSEITERITKAKAGEASAPAKQAPQEYAAWEAENTWYTNPVTHEDVQRVNFANKIAKDCQDANMSPSRVVAVVNEELAKRDANSSAETVQRQTQTNQRRSAPVEGARRSAPSKAQGLQYSQLSAADKASCDEAVAESGGEITRESWVAGLSQIPESPIG